MRKLFTSLLLLCALSALVVPQSLVNGPASVRGQGVVRRAAAGGSSTIVYDQFTDSFMNITAHTPNVGGAWAALGSEGAYIRNNKADPFTESPEYRNAANPASADYDVEADILFNTTTTGTWFAGVQGRINDADPDNYYWARYLVSAGGWRLERVVNGGITQLGSTYSDAPSNGTTRTVRLKMVGTAIELLVGGVSRVGPITDATFSSAGKGGFKMQGGTDTDGLIMDDFWIGPNGGTRGP